MSTVQEASKGKKCIGCGKTHQNYGGTILYFPKADWLTGLTCNECGADNGDYILYHNGTVQKTRRKATSRRVKQLIPIARDTLKDKKFVKARTLSRKLGITPSLAGQVLHALPEWSKYTHTNSQPTWIKGDFE